ncbi:PREDICTED: cysteine--tRNA ligase, cytoplasmic-like [Acropora digitifera]|uniref:cysteine--tRNA ligase, cytoplasmic-like n=1 Tax=Acropora digitifera TaxID=70779 RepID=UPI00077A243B|nr:PREDICTED: cysteine--tRNA ligase, cytoplasmic-like [Acropora digitifera]
MEFKVCTLSYRLRFFQLTYGPSAKHASHKSMGKNKDLAYGLVKLSKTTAIVQSSKQSNKLVAIPPAGLLKAALFFRYETNGSVYFATIKFGSSGKHAYARLVPEAIGDMEALAEGEGQKKMNAFIQIENIDKKFLCNQTLSGKSPLPCAILGNSIDIHTGGVDLKFPHHDNELAQSEAHYGVSQWIHYFLHAGHLTIEGCKMSKSLKNFITIKEALKRNSSRQIRFAFLLHAWNATLDYSENVLREAEQTDKLFNDFFLNVKDILRKPEDTAPSAHNYHELERDLQEKFMSKKVAIHDALCDSIDTPSAIRHMQDLVKHANIYISSKKDKKESPNHQALEMIAKYLTHMLKIFGTIDEEQAIGFPVAGKSAAENHEDVAMPYVQLLADFRDDVRSIAREEKVSRILQACDRLRDDNLPELGVKLEDVEGGHAPVIKFVDRETLLKEKQQQLEEQEKKRKLKEEAKKKLELEKAAKEAKWFISLGVPTHDHAGEPLSGKLIKKLRKLYQQQEKLYNSTRPGAIQAANGASEH